MSNRERREEKNITPNVPPITLKSHPHFEQEILVFVYCICLKNRFNIK
jgi:hypothetical protein